MILGVLYLAGCDGKFMGVVLLFLGATTPIYTDPVQIAGPRVPHLRWSLGKIQPKEQELVSSTTSGQFISALGPVEKIVECSLHRAWNWIGSDWILEVLINASLWHVVLNESLNSMKGMKTN